MKKLILSFIKSHEQKSKLDLISELLVSGSVKENIELFNKVKANFFFNMKVEQNNKEKEIELINSLKPIKKEYDPNFDKKLSEIEVDYQIVKK